MYNIIAEFADHHPTAAVTGFLLGLLLIGIMLNTAWSEYLDHKYGGWSDTGDRKVGGN
ncbi:MAG TPA: hypothetical protein VHC71_05900 [Hyphomicrobium sp.]|jgi:hypothetical protein|nr:hypothetical protein [Hyphomicrobium sp.]